MSQHARPVGPSVNDAAPVTSSMFYGSQPDRNRQRLGPRIGLPTHIPAVVDAPFTSSMSAGYQPDRGYKTPQITHLGWQTREPDVTQAAIEQTIGYHPDRPLNFTPRRGPSFFPWSGTTAFSIDQVIGQQPSQNRAFKTQVQGQQVLPSVDAFSVEMVIGSHPDRNRQVLGPRIDLPNNAAILRFGGAPFSVEMAIGYYPDQNRAFRPKNTGTSLLPSVELFQSESVIGYHPDTARFFKGPRPLGWQISQTTQTDAPIAPNMLDGNKPARSRAFPPKNQGVQLWVSDINPFSIDMTAGNHPDRARFFSGPRPLGLQVSQTTHVPAAFSVDMTVADRPAKNRAFPPKNQTTVQMSAIDVAAFLAFLIELANQYIGKTSSQPVTK